MKRLWLLLLLFFCSCSAPSSSTDPAPDYTLAEPVFAVLAQKALSYQIDFDLVAWADLLADDVVFWPPDDQPPWRGKAAVVAGWQRWRQQTGVRELQLAGQTHLPLRLSRGLLTDHRPGVYVLSYYTAQAALTNGQHRQWRLNHCSHFNADKRIDWGWLSTSDLTPALD